jgi:hypothetical protein
MSGVAASVSLILHHGPVVDVVCSTSMMMLKTVSHCAIDLFIFYVFAVLYAFLWTFINPMCT